VATGVPKDPKAASFKRAGEETGARKKVAPDNKEAADEKALVDEKAGAGGEAAGSVAAVGKASGKAEDKPAPKAPDKTAGPQKPGAKKPTPVMMAAAAAGFLVLVGVGAIALRGGSQGDNSASQGSLLTQDNSAQTIAAVGPVGGVPPQQNAATDVTENGAPPAADQQSGASSSSQLDAEKAKTQAAEAQLAALKKAQAKAASSQLASASPELAAKKNGKTSTAEITATPDAAVSSATLSQFNSTIDDARSMAKQVMHSGSGQNVQLARNYDSYLKTLQASMRGIQTEKEAQKLLKQANQTRAYIVFLQKQPASQ
jgi:hypothetical protein